LVKAKQYVPIVDMDPAIETEVRGMHKRHPGVPEIEVLYEIDIKSAGLYFYELEEDLKKARNDLKQYKFELKSTTRK